jgi:transposase
MPKSGRLSEEVSYPIKKELQESIQGWTAKQVVELIVEKNGINYHTSAYAIFFVNVDSNRWYQ